MCTPLFLVVFLYTRVYHTMKVTLMQLKFALRINLRVLYFPGGTCPQTSDRYINIHYLISRTAPA